MQRRHFALSAAAVVLAFSSGLPSQTVQAQGPQQPPSVTFQVEVDYVDVDAVVTDEQGNFITGLTRDDFEVFEDGNPQKVEMFSFIEIPVEKTDRFLIGDRPVRSDARSNRQPFSGRLYTIVLDDLGVGALRSGQTRQTARQFIEQHMGENDLAAVVYTSGRTDAAQEFTNDRQLLIAAIDKFIGRRMRSLTIERLDSYYQRIVTAGQENDPNNSEPTPTDLGGHSRMDPTDLERGFRAVSVLDTLKNVSEFLAGIRGRRKAVIFLSEGIDYPITDLFGSQNASDVIRATQDAINMAAHSNVSYFTVDPRGLVGMTAEFMEMQGSGAPELAGGPAMGTPGVNTPVMGITGGTGPLIGQSELMHEFQLGQNSLRTLADETGGIAAVNSNDLASAFERIVEANSRYYVLGYYPPTHARDGRFHRIEVKMKNRPGLRVAARRGYASPRGRTVEERKRDEAAKRARDARRPDADQTSTELRELLANPMQQSGLTFAVQAAPFKSTAREASIALAIEFDGSRLQFAPPDDKGLLTNSIELSFFSMTEQAKALGGIRSNLSLTLRPETRDRVLAHGVRVNQRISLQPGRYQIRVGARTAVGQQSGSVFYDLEVPDFRKDKLMLSGLLIASANAQQTPTMQADAVVAKLLPGTATSRREFATGDLLTLYTEVYDNISTQQARNIDLAVRLISETGTEVFAGRDEVANGSTKPWQIYGYAPQVSLNDVPPGRYVLRVEAQVRGNVEGAKPAMRETLITIGSVR